MKQDKDHQDDIETLTQKAFADIHTLVSDVQKSLNDALATYWSEPSMMSPYLSTRMGDENVTLILTTLHRHLVKFVIEHLIDAQLDDRARILRGILEQAYRSDDDSVTIRRAVLYRIVTNQPIAPKDVRE